MIFRRRRPSFKKSLGFTLVETLVAMVIMSGGVMVLANSWSGNFMRIRNSRINNTMAILLERKMTETDVKYKDRSFEEIPEAEAGDFGTKYPGYRWEMKAKKFEMPDMSSALISKEGGADEMMLMIVRTVQDFIKEAVKEVSVTVYYKGRVGKEVRNTVTVYVVDYTKELPVPAGMGAMGGAGGGGLGGGLGGGGGR